MGGARRVKRVAGEIVKKVVCCRQIYEEAVSSKAFKETSPIVVGGPFRAIVWRNT